MHGAMALARSKVTAEGRISIPAAIRRKLGIGPGSILEWDADGQHVTIRKVGRHSSEEIHRAIFARPPKARTLDDLKEAIRQRAREKHARR